MDIKQQLSNLPTWQKIALSVASVIAVSYFLIYPKYEEYSALNDEVQKLEKEVEVLKASTNPQTQLLLQKKLKQTEAEIEDVKGKMATIERIIPSKPNLDDILNVISLSAKKDNVILNSLKVDKVEDVILYYDKNANKLLPFNPTQTQSNDKKQQQKIPENAIKLKKISITANISGDFNSTRDFVKDLSNSARFISIENISIKKVNELLNSTINIATYYGE